MIVRYSLLPALLLVLCSAVEARSEQTVNGLPFADEYVWRADYYVHEDAWRPGYAETLRTLVVATESATDILQTTVSPEDWSCPVRFQQRRMLRFAPSQPDYEEIGDFCGTGQRRQARRRPGQGARSKRRSWSENGMTTLNSDKRQHKRYKRRMKVRWWAEAAGLDSTGFTVDASNSGLLIETGRPIEIGTRLHLEITLGVGVPFFAECIVARKRTYPPQARALFRPAVGVRFVTLNEAIKDLLAKSGEESVGTQEPLHVPLQADLRDYDHLEAVYQKDIRYGGLMVETTELPDLQEEIVVPILLPEPHGQIDCRATVLKLFDDPPGIALRLEEVELVRVRLAEILGSRPAL